MSKDTAKKEIRIPPLSLSNALSTAEKNVAYKPAKVTSLVNRPSEGSGGVLHDVSMSRLQASIDDS